MITFFPQAGGKLNFYVRSFFSMCTTSCIDGKVDKTHQHCMFLFPPLLFSFKMHSSSFWGQKIDPGLFKSLFCWKRRNITKRLLQILTLNRNKVIFVFQLKPYCSSGHVRQKYINEWARTKNHCEDQQLQSVQLMLH